MSNQRVHPCDSNYDQVHKSIFLGRIIPIFICVFGYEMSHMHQEIHVQIAFFSLPHHPTMLLLLPLYDLKWLGFTLNHATQRKRNTHAQVISSCCNLPVSTIFQTKESPQPTSSMKSPLYKSTFVMRVANAPTLLKHTNELSKVLQVE
jgi:hypothetical protein